jgi:hypothetical protein
MHGRIDPLSRIGAIPGGSPGPWSARKGPQGSATARDPRLVADMRELCRLCHFSVAHGCFGVSGDRVATNAAIQGADLMAPPP